VTAERVPCAAAGLFRDKHQCVGSWYVVLDPQGSTFDLCSAACLVEYATLGALPSDAEAPEGNSSMTSAPRDFTTRLALARAMIRHGASPAPAHVADQVAAAAADTRGLHDRLGLMLPLLEPERHWRHRVDTSPSTTTRMYLLAALMACTMICPHLRGGGPQPAIARLPLHRVDCERCAQTLRRRPPDDEDRCDARGVAIFHLFAVHLGPTLITGDACPRCADVLGIRFSEAVS
jgi:hypothetical protein